MKPPQPIIVIDLFPEILDALLDLLLGLSDDQVTLDQDLAWRLFTKGIGEETARSGHYHR